MEELLQEILYNVKAIKKVMRAMKYVTLNETSNMMVKSLNILGKTDSENEYIPPLCDDEEELLLWFRNKVNKLTKRKKHLSKVRF